VSSSTPPPSKQLIVPGEVFVVGGRTGFLFTPATIPGRRGDAKPWIMHSPTLPGLPDKAEQWMHEQFTRAGIDSGESYGSPEAVKAAEALHAEMVRRGYSTRPACHFSSSMETATRSCRSARSRPN